MREEEECGERPRHANASNMQRGECSRTLESRFTKWVMCSIDSLHRPTKVVGGWSGGGWAPSFSMRHRWRPRRSQGRVPLSSAGGHSCRRPMGGNTATGYLRCTALQKHGRTAHKWKRPPREIRRRAKRVHRKHRRGIAASETNATQPVRRRRQQPRDNIHIHVRVLPSARLPSTTLQVHPAKKRKPS